MPTEAEMERNIELALKHPSWQDLGRNAWAETNQALVAAVPIVRRTGVESRPGTSRSSTSSRSTRGSPRRSADDDPSEPEPLAVRLRPAGSFLAVVHDAPDDLLHPIFEAARLLEAA